MTYSERFSDLECKQLYAELVMSSVCGYSGNEGAVFVEMASRDHLETPKRLPSSRRSWRDILHLPLFGHPSLT